MPNPPKKSNRRCMWYNELGWPRINPRLVKKGRTGKDTLGCEFLNRCRFMHPDDPEWDKAGFSTPDFRMYDGAPIPRTPTPPRAGLRDRTPERSGTKVKEEFLSPRLMLGGDKPRPSNESSSTALGATNGSRSPTSNIATKEKERAYSSPRRASHSHRGRSRSRSRSHDHDESRDSYREKSYRDYSRDRDRGRDRSSDRDYDRDEGRLKGSKPRDRSPTSSSASYESRRRHKNTNGDVSTPTQSSFFDQNYARRSPSHQIPQASTSYLNQDPDQKNDNTLYAEGVDAALGGQPVAPQALRETDRAHSPPLSKSSLFRNSTSAFRLLPRPDSATSQLSFAMPPPPTPLSLPPPPTLPDSFLAQLEMPKRVLLSAEERMKAWEERVQLLAESVNARQAHQSLVAQVAELRQMMDAPRYSQMPAAVQASMTTSLKDAEQRAEAAEEHVTATMEKIYMADFWPVRKKPDPGGAESSSPKADWEEEHDILRQTVGDLDDAIRRVDRMLKEVIAFVSARGRSASVSSSATIGAPDKRVSSDWGAESTRATKRRRVGDIREAITSEDETPALLPSIDSLDAPDASRLTRRIGALEARFAELDNDYNQVENEITATVDAYVDDRLADIRSELAKGIRMRHAETVEQLRKDVDQTGNDLGELAGEVGELFLQLGIFKQRDTDRTSETERLTNEIAEMKAALQAERTKTEEMRAQLRETIEETKALNLVVQKALRPPPAAVHIPSVEDLASALRPLLVDAVRDDVGTLVTDLRGNLAQSVKNSISTTQLDQLKEKLDKLSRLPDVIAFAERLDNPKNGTHLHNTP